MKSLIAIALVLSSAAPAFARSQPYREPAPASAQKISNDEVQVALFGEGARQLFEALDVEAKFEFGFVQLWTKETKNVSCSRAVMGDIPGQMSGPMSGPKYNCRITESVR
jgi:hypothetical protein